MSRHCLLPTLILALSAACLPASAQADGAWAAASDAPAAVQVAPLASPHRPRIGLVLSGGGARGFAHIGILKALEQAHVPIDLVVGTSMGAIVGGLYASGMSPQALEQELMAIQWDGVFDSRLPRQALSQQRKEADFELSHALQIGFRDGEFRMPSGAVSSRSLEWLLRKYTLHTRQLSSFDALPTRFRAVATDMETGEAVVMSDGDLAAALRASMSVPGVFAPMELEDRLLGDGGLVNNLPVDVARDMGADVVIAVNIGTPLGNRSTLTSVLGVSMQMINILTEQNVQRSIAMLTRNDLLLAPSLEGVSSSDFKRARDITDRGYEYGQLVQAALERFALPASDYAQWQLERKPYAAPDPRALAFVRFEGVNATQARQLARLVDTHAGAPLDAATLQADLTFLSASGDYEHVDYRLVPDPVTLQDGLVFDLKDNNWGPNYLKLGLDMRTDFQGESGFNLRLHHNRHWLTPDGTEWRNQIEIGDRNGLRTELFHPLGGEHDRFFSAQASVLRQSVDLYDGSGTALGRYGRRTVSIGVDHGWTLGRGGRLGAARVGLFSANRMVEPLLISRAATSTTVQRWSEAGVHASLVMDQLDYPNFPLQGYRWVAEAAIGRRNGPEQSASFNRTTLRGTQVFTWGPHTLNLHLRASRTTNMHSGVLDEYALGGFQQLSGYKVGQVSGNYVALGRVGYYRQLGLNPGIARAFFWGASLELGNAWNRAGEISGKGLKSGASLYVAADTGIGPVYLSLVRSPGQSTGVYLFLGRP